VFFLVVGSMLTATPMRGVLCVCKCGALGAAIFESSYQSDACEGECVNACGVNSSFH